MSDENKIQIPVWLSRIVEKAMRPTGDMGHDESWATPTHVIGAEAVEANGDVCSDYASDLVGLLLDEIERLRKLLVTACDAWERSEKFTVDINREWDGTIVVPKRMTILLPREWYDAARQACGGEGVLDLVAKKG